MPNNFDQQNDAYEIEPSNTGRESLIDPTTNIDDPSFSGEFQFDIDLEFKLTPLSQLDNNKPKSILKRCDSKERKSVNFSITEVRTFPQILGDNPCCSSGLPLALDWKPISEYSVPFHEYGFQRIAQVARLDACRRKEILQRSSIMLSSGGQKNYVQLNTKSHPIRAYSESDLKRAERRMFRARTNASRKAVNRFFESPTTVR